MAGESRIRGRRDTKEKQNEIQAQYKMYTLCVFACVQKHDGNVCYGCYEFSREKDEFSTKLVKIYSDFQTESVQSSFVRTFNPNVQWKRRPEKENEMRKKIITSPSSPLSSSTPSLRAAMCVFVLAEMNDFPKTSYSSTKVKFSMPLIYEDYANYIKIC